MSMNDEEVRVLPRSGLSENAFRAYEDVIAHVAKYGTVDVDPRKMGNGVSQNTYIARFKDAMLGYEKYGYVSKVIPSKFDRRNFTAVALSNGKVRLVNKHAELLKEASRSLVPDAFDTSELDKIVSHFRESSAEDEASLFFGQHTVKVNCSSQNAAQRVIDYIKSKRNDLELEYVESKQWVAITAKGEVTSAEDILARMAGGKE